MHSLVRNTMLANASVTDQLGHRIRWVHAKDGEEYPLAVMQKVSERREVSLDGDTGMGRHLVQFDIYATQHRDMRLAQSAVRKLWSGFRSDEIAGAFVQNVRETVERKTGDRELLYRASIDVLIVIKETEDE